MEGEQNKENVGFGMKEFGNVLKKLKAEKQLKEEEERKAKELADKNKEDAGFGMKEFGAVLRKLKEEKQRKEEEERKAKEDADNEPPSQGTKGLAETLKRLKVEK